MKTNVMHILLIAVVLLAGWSASTFIQDYYHTNANESTNPVSMFELTKKYFPQVPDNYFFQQEMLAIQESNKSDSSPKSSLLVFDSTSERDKLSLSDRVKRGAFSHGISMLNVLDEQSDEDNSGGNGNTNAFFFIDIPVGDGLFVFLFLTFLLYVPYKLMKSDFL